MRKNIDIETFYFKNKNAISLASSFFGKSLKNIIVSCRLKPYGIFTEKYKASKLETIWVDEFGGSVHIKNKKINAILKDNDLRKDTKISTDLFSSLSICNIAKISKSLIIGDNHLLFYGIDEYFRCFNFKGISVSPLEFGVENILVIFKYIKNKIKKCNDFVIYSLPNNEIQIMLDKEYNK